MSTTSTVRVGLIGDRDLSVSAHRAIEQALPLTADVSGIHLEYETGRGDHPRDFKEVISDKLYWTIQVETPGELVAKGAQGRLQVNSQ